MKDLHDKIDEILEKHFNACWVAFQGLNIPDDNNKYLEAQEATDQILTLLEKEIQKAIPKERDLKRNYETTGDPEHEWFQRAVKDQKEIDYQYSRGYNQCREDILKQLEKGE